MRTTADRTPSERGRRRLRPSLHWVAATVLALTLAGCSGDDEGSGGAERAPAGASDTAVRTNTGLGVVRGPLAKAKAEDVRTEVTAVVERWSERAYGGDYPREDFDAAFEEFTAQAGALARKQAGIMSNARLGADLEGVELVQRVVRVDVVGPRGKPAGATARFRLRFTTSGGEERTHLVAGRLLLTPTKDGWRVFGFDVRREEGAK